MDDHELNFVSSLGHDSSSKASSERMNRRQSKVSIFHLAAFVFVLGFSFLVAGIVLITLSQTRSSETKKNSALNQTITRKVNSTFGENETIAESRCAFSSEAQLAGLEAFFIKVKEERKHFTPYRSYLTKEKFEPYNPEPQAIKKLTDQTMRLYEELLEIKGGLDVGKLKLHERRQLAVAEHELKHFFGKPYGNNYYTGAWMLGPNQRCTSEPITSLPAHLRVALYIFLKNQNKTLKVAENAMKILPKFREGIQQYKFNLQRGVASGMIRSRSECAEGLNCMKGKYRDLFTRKSPEAVLSWYGVRRDIENFARHVNMQDSSLWINKYGKNMSDSLTNAVVEFIGMPLVSLFDYLENDHMAHCVPSNVSSGLGTRPVDHVYVNGTKTSVKTNQTLDGKERIMKGKDAYAEILSYFTTTKYTPGKH
ncbi:hypothetical protein AWC38_SpisGene2683 [Stylophora pistillata]|uniref:Uncharacterized protein n=1 Tax=Stylophora pistillata TaxID=50429 RepID=A0A2B4SUD8_STYPI|nr:hypothetical protein AWC38_SpisGene2683 [Stylophora pistillata]